MTIQNDLAQGFNKIINRVGTTIKVQYFTSTIGSVYDDDVTWALSGTEIWTSGLILPLSQQEGSSESILVEQGKLINDDKRLYLHGSLILTGSEMTVTVQVGSPTGENYSMIDTSLRFDVSNIPIYKKVFLRNIGGVGSLLGES